MAIRWIHKAWSVFWTYFGITVAVILVLGVIGFGVLQLPASKSYIVSKIEERFNTQHQGVLKFGKFSGTFPVSFEFENVALYPDSSLKNPIFETDTITATLDFWALFRNRFVVNSLNVKSPKLVLEKDSSRSILNAIRKRNVVQTNSSAITSAPANPFVEILAPSVILSNGTVVMKEVIPNLPNDLDSVTFQDLNINMFLDYNHEGRFVDIDQLSMKIPEFDVENISLYGQVFNDNQFLELNAFNINFGNSILRFGMEADGVDIFKGEIVNQLNTSQLSLDINEFKIEPSLITRVFENYPYSQKNLSLNLNAEGSVDSLWVEEFLLGFGESSFEGFGYIKNPLLSQALFFDSEIHDIYLDSTDILTIFENITPNQLGAITSSSVDIKTSGNSEKVNSLIELSGARGNALLESELFLNDELSFGTFVTVDSVNLGMLFTDQIVQSDISGFINIETSSLKEIKNSVGEAEFDFQNGSINGVSYDSLSITGNWDSGIVSPSFKLQSPETEVRGMGTIQLTDSIPSIEFTGSAKNLNVKALTQSEVMSEAFVDLDYEVFLSGSNRENIYGQVSLDIPFSVVNGDTLPLHQIYADFNEPGLNTRILRITSTAFDLDVNGQFDPNDMIELAPLWTNYFENRIEEEILFKGTQRADSLEPQVTDQNFSIGLSLKNLALLKAYFPAIPALNSKAQINSNFNVNRERLLFNASVTDSEFSYKNSKADSLVVQITGSFRERQKIKEFSSFRAQVQSSGLETEFISANSFNMSFEMEEDSVLFTQNLTGIADEAALELSGEIALKDSSLDLTVRNFELGSEVYKWQNEGIPFVSYQPENKLRFQDFTFSNFEEFVSIEGTFSNVPSDSVNYVIRSVDLSRISTLVNGRIDFSGELDGRFTTRSLTRIPTIQGELNVFELGLDENIVGDVSLNSVFNRELNRFDTNISINTDSTKYPEYFVRNARLGQDIELNGYVLAPENGEFPDEDSLFNFDLEFENVDLWVIPFIAPKVFAEMSGKASGSGYVWGNLDTYDFSVDYSIGMDDAVYMKPRFLDTFYYGQGLLNFSRENGLDFQDIFIIDPSGGSAILSGTYNLNNFQQIHLIDLELQMDEFQFLNSTLDPTLPFFGDAYGTSTIRMTGTNLNPVLSTATPVYISDFSNIGIPLLEETEFDEDNKFIRFVDDFSVAKKRSSGPASTDAEFTVVEENDPFDRTFIERFTLDLQFIANQPMTVRLIFDPITGDMITANGTGRLRIQLQDEDLSMFGQFDISGGNYNFVSGDIFTRRFEISPGGSIIWEGSPTDARLDLEAVYEARPDINTLTRARAEIDQETSQRVPVQLVLNIEGSLNSIENNFFFRLPNTFESRQNTTLSTQINSLNRNEDEKLIQATSFLLMGDFIPSTSATTSTTNSFTDNFSGSGAVLNPLLSSQVISPLLSNQINSLLRSDIGSLDIDFNLNTYNNVDLAVALRLYNDRIILSREGQITGAQSNIGDIGATYRINQTLSVTAFHRQDPTFSNFGGVDDGRQGQDINGVGLEAEVSFNSWNEFFRKLANPFRRLFGTKDKEEEETEEQTENQNPPSK
ncbi:MAG: hypothetical protein JJ971_12210 [Balneolaceae bacterium]|nr:hypothetical protein [Balneolaceae bacterium]MBO6547385.1 hypothetical protein [Balneolaceae bacterium]MBO6647668.1 hypothetical protein [Balneolaceae bacterium]